jgi:FRG domain
MSDHLQRLWQESRIFNHMLSRKRILESSEGNPNPSAYAFDFERIDSPYRERARYLHSLAPTYWELGSQPSELRLSVEPFHPLSQSQVDRTVNDLLQQAGVKTADPKHEITVLSRVLVESYGPDSIVDLSGIPEGHADLQLFDPLTGFLLWKIGSKWRNFWLGNVATLVDLRQQSERVRRLLIQRESDHFFLGSSIFQRIILPLLNKPLHSTLDTANIPCVSVENQAQLEQLAEDIQNACSLSPIKLEAVYRGQTDEYHLPNRSHLAKAGVCPFSDICDHSFVPSLYRRYDTYLDKLSDFREFLAEMLDWNLYADLIFGDSATYHSLDGTPYEPKELNCPHTVTSSFAFSGRPASNRAFADMGPYMTYKATDGYGEILDEYVKRLRPAQDSVRRNLILQHYGAPTSFVDVTHDIKIAEWFALNKLRTSAVGLSTAGTVKAPFRNPAIFVFLVPCDLAALVDTADLVDSNQSLRPHRQRCALLGGAGNLYRNAASKFVGLKIKFHRTFVPENLPAATWLFPGPEEDFTLKRLLLHQRGTKDNKIFPVYWLPDAAS